MNWTIYLPFDNNLIKQHVIECVPVFQALSLQFVLPFLWIGFHTCHHPKKQCHSEALAKELLHMSQSE